MSTNVMQRLSVPKKENICSRNCLAKSTTNNQYESRMQDHTKCSHNSKFFNTNNLNTSTSIQMNTSRKFVAPLPLISKSTTYDRKFKSKLAQREAEYDKNLKSIKVDLFKNGNFGQKNNLSISMNRMNKFQANRPVSTSSSLVFNRKSFFRDRSRSVNSKKAEHTTTCRKDLEKSTPREDSYVSEKTESNLSEQVSNYGEKQNYNEDNYNTILSAQEEDPNYKTNSEHKEEYNDYMRKEEEINIDLGLIYEVEKNINSNMGNTLNLIANEEVDLLAEIDDNKLMEINMKDQLIFNNQRDQLSIERASFYSRSRSSKNNILMQSQYEYSIPLSQKSHLSQEQMMQCKFNIIPSSYNFIQDNINKINLGIFTCNYENLKTNKENCNRFTREEYRKLLSTYLRFEYGKNILDELYQEEETNEQFLMQHEITERMRMRMIDWMIEVLSNYKCENNTFFLAVNIMDRFFRLTDQNLKPDDLHLIGLCSMFISSKFYDVYPLKLKLVVEKVGHNKFSADEIKNMEEIIVKTINYEILKPTSFEFINYYLEEIFYFIENNFTISNEILSEYFKHLFTSCGIEIKFDFFYYEKYKNTKKFTLNMLNLLRCVVLYLAKMNCQDYNLVCIKPSLLAASSIFVGVKICEQINNEEYINDYFTNKLCEISKQKEHDVIYYAQKILYNAQNFDTLFSGLENLKRVHFNHIHELKETK